MLATQIFQTQIAQAHTSNQILSEPETEQELKNLFQQGLYPEAIDVLEKAAKLAPRNSTILLYLGIARFGQGNVSEAIAIFERAARLDPNNGIIRLQIAKILQIQGNLEEALKAYQQAAQLQPNLVEARKAIADILMEQQDTLMTIAAHRQVLALAPQDASSYYHLGIALKDRGRIEEAIATLEQARTLFQQQRKIKETQQVEAVLRELQEFR